jgi:hypothetical protein
MILYHKLKMYSKYQQFRHEQPATEMLKRKRTTQFSRETRRNSSPFENCVCNT